jgi:hypothetical protein
MPTELAVRTMRNARSNTIGFLFTGLLATVAGGGMVGFFLSQALDSERNTGAFVATFLGGVLLLTGQVLTGVATIAWGVRLGNEATAPD